MYNEINEAVSFMKEANEALKHVRFVSGGSGCNLCCASHGGGKAKYEEKEVINSIKQTK